MSAITPGLAVELDLRGRTAVVVGLGSVGRRKAMTFLAAGARVVGVDPNAREIPWEHAADHAVRRELYRAEHLIGASLVAAAATPDVNRQVVADAQAAGLWVVSASDPEAGNLRLPATWRQGLLTLTVSTTGASPALATALRDQAAAVLGPDAASLTEVFARWRPVILDRLANRPEARRQILADWADPLWPDLLREQGPAAVDAEIARRIAAAEVAAERRDLPEKSV